MLTCNFFYSCKPDVFLSIVHNKFWTMKIPEHVCAIPLHNYLKIIAKILMESRDWVFISYTSFPEGDVW